MMSLVSGEHNTPALSVRMNPTVWCGLMLQQSLGHRRYYHLSNGMESKSVDTRSIYRELGATRGYNMRTRNIYEMNHG